MKFYFYIKYALDFFIAIIAILLLWPFMLIIAIAIKVDSKGAVIFRQKRVGQNKVLFDIYKFRTMNPETPKDVATHMMDTPSRYITKVGAFLRRTSLDELPQLFNILVGNMSLIGPRPALWNQTDLIQMRDQYGVNNIRPGLTGWAQINGRDELPNEIKAYFDGEYVQNFGFKIDLIIFIKTPYLLLTGKDIKGYSPIRSERD